MDSHWNPWLKNIFLSQYLFIAILCLVTRLNKFLKYICNKFTHQTLYLVFQTLASFPLLLPSQHIVQLQLLHHQLQSGLMLQLQFLLLLQFTALHLKSSKAFLYVLISHIYFESINKEAKNLCYSVTKKKHDNVLKAS